MNLPQIMAAIEAKMAETATNAIERPGVGDLFSYGKAVGMYAGLHAAKQIIDEMLRDELKRNGDL